MARNTYEIDEKLDSPFNINHITRSLRYVKEQGALLSLSLLFNVASIILTLLGPYFAKTVLDKTIPNKDIRQLIFIAVLFLLTVLFSSIFNYFQARLSAKAGQQIIHRIREDLFSHLQKLPFNYYDSRPHGKILVRVVNYVNSISNFLSSGLVNLLLQALTIVFIVFFMLSLNVKLSLVIFSGLPLLVLFIFIIKKIQGKAWRDYNNKNSNLNAYLNESIMGIKVTQSFTREEYNAGIFRRLINDTKFTWLKLIKIIFSVPFVIENLTLIISCLVYIAGVFWFKNITIGVLFAMAGYAGRFWQPIQMLGNIYNDLVNTSAYLERIFQVLDEPIEIYDSPEAKDLDIKGNVAFKNIAFSYQEGSTVFDNLSFEIKEGESVALVGPTGAGKTTIVNLLSRFYDINNGDILIDGVPLRNITIKSLRSNIGVMLQDTFIFKGTIYDNIKYGKLDATIDEIETAAKAVHAHEFISEMKEGYYTQLSERGSNLSSGQRQLISFARTLLRNPKILVLDEATSSIDTETEKLLQEGIRALLKGRTSIIIAHRLSTIKNCDKIFYIYNNGISESGSHNELMDKKGLYYNLYTTQLNEA